jgi:hypothetical protein
VNGAFPGSHCEHVGRKSATGSGALAQAARLEDDRSMRVRGRYLVSVAVLVFLVASCDVGHSIEAVNNTEEPALVRLSVLPMDSSVGRYGYVVTVPAHTRIFIANYPFAGDRPSEIEILSTDCAPIADFQDLSLGAQIIIDDGPRAELRHEFPTGNVTAQRTDACPGVLPPPPASPRFSPAPSR